MSRCGLASNGVYMCPSCYQGGGSLLHCLSTLAGQRPAVYFCCTFLGVTSTGRYPASCPVKPGLSSSGTFRHSQPRPFILLTRCILTQFITQCPVQIHFRKWDPKAETPKKGTPKKETPKTKLPNMKTEFLPEAEILAGWLGFPLHGSGIPEVRCPEDGCIRSGRRRYHGPVLFWQEPYRAERLPGRSCSGSTGSPGT